MFRRKVREPIVLVGTTCICLLVSAPARASLTRNAAGPRNMGESRALAVDTSLQLADEEDGRTWTFEIGAQYQLSRRFQLLAEFVGFERLQSDISGFTRGTGDAELTLSWLAFAGSGPLPAAALAARTTLPTSGNSEDGSGDPGYSALFVLGKEMGELELGLEAEYATGGSPVGEELNDRFLYTITAEYSCNDVLSIYTELFGMSRPTAEESRTDAVLGGVEIDLAVSETVAPYVSLEIDTEGVAAARAGVEWTW